MDIREKLNSQENDQCGVSWLHIYIINQQVKMFISDISSYKIQIFFTVVCV